MSLSSAATTTYHFSAYCSNRCTGYFEPSMHRLAHATQYNLMNSRPSVRFIFNFSTLDGISIFWDGVSPFPFLYCLCIWLFSVVQHDQSVVSNLYTRCNPCFEPCLYGLVHAWCYPISSHEFTSFVHLLTYFQHCRLGWSLHLSRQAISFPFNISCEYGFSMYSLPPFIRISSSFICSLFFMLLRICHVEAASPFSLT